MEQNELKQLIKLIKEATPEQLDYALKQRYTHNIKPIYQTILYPYNI